MVITFKGSNNEEDGALEKQDCTDEIKDEKSIDKKESLKNRSSIKECSVGDEQVSTFKSADTGVGNGNEETADIP